MKLVAAIVLFICILIFYLFIRGINANFADLRILFIFYQGQEYSCLFFTVNIYA